MENNELPKNVEEYQEADVFCGDCNGQLVTHEVQSNVQRLFTPQYYKKLVIQCNLCKKQSKVFTSKIVKK